MKNKKICIVCPLMVTIITVIFLFLSGCSLPDAETHSVKDDPVDESGPPVPPEISGVEDGGLYISCRPEFKAPEGEVYSGVLQKENGRPAAFQSGTVIGEDGSYTLTVSTEKNGKSASTTVCFSIDGTPPLTPYVSGKSPTNDFTPTWTWTACDDADVYEYCLDGGEWVVTLSASFTPSSGLSKGTHSFSVRSKDKAGNVSPCASLEIVVNPFVYVATRYGFDYSFDDGYSFRKADIPELTCKSVFGENGVFYVATEMGIAILENVEETGILKKNYSDATNQCNNVFVRDRTVYIATDGGIGILYQGLQNFKFRTTNNGLGHDKCRGIYADGRTIYVATLMGVSISTDGGDTFINVTKGLESTDCRDVYIHEGRIFAATWGGGIGISDDAGQSFTAVTDGLGSVNCYSICAYGKKVFAATTGGVSLSEDGGWTFTPVAADGLIESCIRDITYRYNTLYAATWGGGIGISEDDGATFRMATAETNRLSSDICLGIWVE
ncbi:MAG: hypothetical protein JW881_14665 [Spirochaetales bacterium]|nr:hypothetical protein [Spirochaetales bacterium]